MRVARPVIFGEIYIKSKGVVKLWRYLRTAKDYAEIPDHAFFETWQQKPDIPYGVRWATVYLFMKAQMKLAGTLHITHDYDKKEIRWERWTT